MPFDRVVQPLYYYWQKLHTTQFEKKYPIEALLKTGLRQNLIAKKIGVYPSTIGRELKRNIALRGRTAGDYVASNAQCKTDVRHQQKPKHVLFTAEMKLYF